MNARDIVDALLGAESNTSPALEASVHRPARGRKWVAVFTGPEGGQKWKTTGTEDPVAALAIARAFERQARELRARSGHSGRANQIRLYNSSRNPGAGLTQADVARLLGLSVRAVRQIEKRALAKLARHPQLRALWREFVTGKMEEANGRLGPAEVQSLLGLVRTRSESHALNKALNVLASP